MSVRESLDELQLTDRTPPQSDSLSSGCYARRMYTIYDSAYDRILLLELVVVAVRISYRSMTRDLRWLVTDDQLLVLTQIILAPTYIKHMRATL